MKVLQISTVCGSGSVGRITVDIYHTLKSCGDEGLIAYGRRQAPEGVEAFRFGSDLFAKCGWTHFHYGRNAKC